MKCRNWTGKLFWDLCEKKRCLRTGLGSIGTSFSTFVQRPHIVERRKKKGIQRSVMQPLASRVDKVPPGGHRRARLESMSGPRRACCGRRAGDPGLTFCPPQGTNGDKRWTEDSPLSYGLPSELPEGQQTVDGDNQGTSDMKDGIPTDLIEFNDRNRMKKRGHTQKLLLRSIQCLVKTKTALGPHPIKSPNCRQMGK